jgi:hypothetical protein
MKEVFYSIWCIIYNRWTNMSLTVQGHPCNGIQQDINLPFLLTLEQAEEWLSHVCLQREYEIRVVVPPRPEKVIPDYPLDPSLPVLMAGYIQDRQRKRS